ncbi:unnamed protein product [Rotaria sp. Silwood1]|nr:unnamed protein product [Rotaria sp. Silwood1]
MKAHGRESMSSIDASVDSNSTVNLISVRRIRDSSVEPMYIWMYQSNIDSWDDTQTAEWTPYPDDVSAVIEQAFNAGLGHIFIDQCYKIDLEKLVQVNIEDVHRQRRIRRQICMLYVNNNENIEDKTGILKRLCFPLETSPRNSTAIDTLYRGSPFIRDWLLTFNYGQFVLTFDTIFPALLNGLKDEGEKENEQKSIISEIVQELNAVRDKTSENKERDRMKMLANCCAKLYTKHCYIFRVVNTALRENDREKLHTLGPYCYVLYNYVGRPCEDFFSIRRYFWHKFHATESSSVTVYRGDYITSERIEEYRQAAGNKHKYFKWLPFVSTSLKQNVAENFGFNVTYVIELRRHSCDDQFTFLDQNTHYKQEEELLLRPGTRFRVTAVQYDNLTRRPLIYIKILPTYVSHLR